jgi:hypothetical protein
MGVMKLSHQHPSFLVTFHRVQNNIWGASTFHDAHKNLKACWSPDRYLALVVEVAQDGRCGISAGNRREALVSR